MIEHCISAFQKKQDEKAFLIYVTEALRLIAENTAHLVRGGGKSMNKTYLEIIDRTPKPKEDTRQCEEIVSDIWARAGIGRGKRDVAS